MASNNFWLAREFPWPNLTKSRSGAAGAFRSIVNLGYCTVLIVFGHFPPLQKPNAGTGERLDEEMTVMRVYMNKMKTEAKMLHSRVNQLEEERVQNVQLMRKSEDESKDYAIRVREVRYFDYCPINPPFTLLLPLNSTAVLLTCARWAKGIEELLCLLARFSLPNHVTHVV